MNFYQQLQRLGYLLVLAAFLMLGGCATPRPHNIDNICAIYHQYPQWYRDTVKTQRRWGIPTYIQMAIIYQESHFNETAKPAREHFLGFIPGPRPTSAYGYSQSLNATWRLYKRDVGRYNASRTNFADAVDFIGWYSAVAHREAHVSLYNAYALYLAYHEGIKGYVEHTYWHKPWLISVAHKVAYHALLYQHQMWSCIKRA